MQNQLIQQTVNLTPGKSGEIVLILPKNSGLKDSFSKVITMLQDYTITKILSVRGEDIPYWVSLMRNNGKNAVGVTGQDLLTEWMNAGNTSDGLTVETVDWYDDTAIFKKPALCLIGQNDLSYYKNQKSLTICICAKYKNTAELYLTQLESQGYQINRIYINGSLEDTCIEGLADMIIDIVYTGKSMKEAGLKIIDTLMTSDVAVIKGVA